ncbi:hypothetical protein ABIE12_004541 [Serratia sp. 509]
MTVFMLAQFLGGVINSLEMFGMSQANAVTVGVIVGGMGVERCLAIIRMVASMKTNTPLDEKERWPINSF